MAPSKNTRSQTKNDTNVVSYINKRIYNPYDDYYNDDYYEGGYNDYLPETIKQPPKNPPNKYNGSPQPSATIQYPPPPNRFNRGYIGDKPRGVGPVATEFGHVVMFVVVLALIGVGIKAFVGNKSDSDMLGDDEVIDFNDPIIPDDDDSPTRDDYFNELLRKERETYGGNPSIEAAIKMDDIARKSTIIGYVALAIVATIALVVIMDLMSIGFMKVIDYGHSVIFYMTVAVFLSSLGLIIAMSVTMYNYDKWEERFDKIMDSMGDFIDGSLYDFKKDDDIRKKDKVKKRTMGIRSFFFKLEEVVGEDKDTVARRIRRSEDINEFGYIAILVLTCAVFGISFFILFKLSKSEGKKITEGKDRIYKLLGEWGEKDAEIKKLLNGIKKAENEKARTVLPKGKELTKLREYIPENKITGDVAKLVHDNNLILLGGAKTRDSIVAMLKKIEFT